MSITIQLDLPEILLNDAKADGLLDSVHIGELLEFELRRRKAARELESVLQKIRAQPGEPMSSEEIAAEIKAARAERRAHETGA